MRRPRQYVGMGIILQAGVAIGLALIVKHEFGQLADEYGLAHAADIVAITITTVTALLASCLPR